MINKDFNVKIGGILGNIDFFIKNLHTLNNLYFIHSLCLDTKQKPWDFFATGPNWVRQKTLRPIDDILSIVTTTQQMSK